MAYANTEKKLLKKAKKGKKEADKKAKDAQPEKKKDKKDLTQKVLGLLKAEGPPKPSY